MAHLPSGIHLNQAQSAEHPTGVLLGWATSSTLYITWICLTPNDNHDGVITHLEPDILECEVKWALGCITTNKASGGDGIPVELFQILKDDAVKVLLSICQQIWKTHSGQRAGKGQFSFQSLRMAIPKNAQTTTQLYSSHMLVK